MSCPDRGLYFESSTFGHKDPANISQQEIEKQPNLGFGQPKTAALQKYVLHTPFQSADKDFHPIYAGKDHSQPRDKKYSSYETLMC